MSEKEAVFKQHEENTEWSKNLDFYADEIKIFTKRLEEIASKNTVQQVRAEIEKFQNQFIVQKNNIDEIAHAVTINEDILMNEIKKNEFASDHRKVENHTKEKEMVESFEKNFKNLREEFNRFSAKWM